MKRSSVNSELTVKQGLGSVKRSTVCSEFNVKRVRHSACGKPVGGAREGTGPPSSQAGPRALFVNGFAALHFTFESLRFQALRFSNRFDFEFDNISNLEPHTLTGSAD